MCRWAWLVFTCALSACTSYEYEEEVFLEVDGSGRLRVSGSTEILEALHLSEGDDTLSTASGMTTRFAGPGLELDSVRETARDGRTFVHVQGRFESWKELCAHPAFAERGCDLDSSEDELVLRFSLPAPRTGVPDGVPSDAPLALRFHFPSTVRFHNSRGDIERGNIIGWERTASEHFGAPDLTVEAKFERRSVLATTVVVLGTAVGVVVLSVALALFLLVRKGRRQLALEATESLGAHSSTAQRP